MNINMPLHFQIASTPLYYTIIAVAHAYSEYHYYYT